MESSANLSGRHGVVLPGPGYVDPATAPRKSVNFEAYVRAEASKESLATIQGAHRFLEELIARLEAETVPDLRVGVPVHASHLEYEWQTYGVVLELDGQSAVIAIPGRAEPERVELHDQHIRVLSDDEWAHLEPRLLKRNERIAEERKPA